MIPSLYRRRPTRAVFIGQVGVGGLNPIRIQSMTTADTKDTESTVREITELVNAGCEIVRLTVPTQADCDNLKNIRREMTARGLKVPLVADIHFTPTVAMKVVDYVEKVRINPGNFADKKLFKTFEIKDEDYQAELNRIEEKFAPLVLKCKERGVAMRIGTNHGSLSDRIMNRYGDTPEGMVESALEFLRIATRLNYHDIVLSMKASNPQVMVTAYRLLVKRMTAEGMDYPLHLGVTEAGEGEDARIKSAIGIGTLLEEGIGDTVRVSLTEDSIHEIPVAGALVSPYNQKFFVNEFQGRPKIHSHLCFLQDGNFQLTYSRIPSLKQNAGTLSFGGSDLVRVWTDFGDNSLKEISNTNTSEMKFEGIEFTTNNFSPDLARQAKEQGFATSLKSDDATLLAETKGLDKKSYVIHSRQSLGGLEPLAIACINDSAHLELCFDTAGNFFFSEALPSLLRHTSDLFKRMEFKTFSFSLLANNNASFCYRILQKALTDAGLSQPILLRYQSTGLPAILGASVQMGSLLIDGYGDGLQISGKLPLAEKLTLSYGILQASRVRISKTEFIACPSCGRTQFNLQEVTARIKARTSHLKGLKIAIMGCIVNGPGEMADADFGYVGTGTGKISLYVGKECVERNISEINALESLINLIKNHDKWIDAN